MSPHLHPHPDPDPHPAPDTRPSLPPLRFVTAGSVDDGKSTLIGRLLFDSRGIFEDQLAGVRRASLKHGTTGGDLDLALVTDGLKAEREQGITIDVAYRYFATPRRKFIIADSPGHEQYTRNMATGASTADAAVLLVDATQGVVTQTRRHAFILALLGVRHFAVAVNKMDLVGWDRSRFEAIVRDFEALRHQIARRDATTRPQVAYIPLSALTGENVTTPTDAAAWYDGAALLEWLEAVDAEPDASAGPLRLPVQLVSRPHADFRGYMGTLARGTIRPGDAVTILPAGVRSVVKSVFDADGETAEAATPRAVTVTLADDVDASRGDLLATPDALPHVGRLFEATLVWLTGEGLVPGRHYRLKHTTRQTTAVVRSLVYGVDVNTMQRVEAATLATNGVGRCVIESATPLVFDAYRDNRRTGAFVLIDRGTLNTVAAGMIVGPADAAPPGGASHPVTAAERAARLNQRPAVVWLTGDDIVHARLVADALDRRLFDAGYVAAVVDVAAVHRQAALAVVRHAGLIAVAVVPDGDQCEDNADGVVAWRVDARDASVQAADVLRVLEPLARPSAPVPDFSI